MTCASTSAPAADAPGRPGRGAERTSRVALMEIEAKRDGKRLVYLAAAVSALGGLLFGYDIGVISGAILFIKNDFSLSPGLQEIVVSSVLLGALVGALAGGILADRIGRRRLLIATAAVFGVGAIGAALAPRRCPIAARVVAGAAIGTASFVAPLYISEIAPLEIRGRLVSINQVALTSGIVISYGIDYAFAGAGAWRWMFALAVIPAAVFGRNAVRPGQPTLAGRPRTRGQGSGRAEQDSRPGRGGGRIRRSRTAWRSRKGTGLSCSVRCCDQRWSWVSAWPSRSRSPASTRSSTTRRRSSLCRHVLASVAILASVGVGVVNVLLTLVAMQLIDRVGRRPLLLVSLAGMALSLFVLGLAFAFPQLAGSLGWIAVVSLMVYVGSFAVGLGPVFWLMLSEIYPLRIRGRAMSVGTLANWSANLIVPRRS